MKDYSLKSAVLASLRAVDSENSPYYLKAILVFHSSVSRIIGAGSSSFSSHLGPVRGDKVKAKDEGKAVIWTLLHTRNYHTSLLIYLECLQTHLQNFGQPWNCIQEQTTNVKVPWNSYKPHFGKKLCLYPLNSASAN